MSVFAMEGKPNIASDKYRLRLDSMMRIVILNAGDKKCSFAFVVDVENSFESWRQ